MASMSSSSNSLSFRLPQYLRPYFAISLVVSCVLTLVTTIFYFQARPVLPLFYSLGEPTDYVVPKIWIFFFPAFSFAITILHLLLLPSLSSYHKVMNQLFGWVTVTMQAICVVAAIRIILITW
jgi:magnesium-transporting ATPase (P-type)